MTPRGDIAVKVWGEYACFSRPEFKVERVSYPVMTPSAARGVLEAIFWKPEIRYEIREILVVKMGSQTTVLRNEIGCRQGSKPLLVEDERQQRTSLILKGVEYVIHASVRLRPHTRDPLPKYVEQFERRVGRGQCFHQPYFGTREFSAYFEAATGADRPESVNQTIGTMLFDLAFVRTGDPKKGEMYFLDHSNNVRREVRGRAHALFFNAELKDGRLLVPQEKYQELYALEQASA